jgi:hypothetical protein
MNIVKENNDKQRVCPKCREVKLLNTDNFQKDKSRQYGFYYLCKPCEKIRSRERYLKNPRLDRWSKFSEEEKEKCYAIGRIYIKTEKGRAISLLQSHKRFDKKKNRECNLSQEYVIKNILYEKCFYCGFSAENMGCDRLDNLIGHIIGNVVPCCPDCNVARSNNFTVEEMKIIGLAIREIKLKRIDEGKPISVAFTKISL